MIARLLLALALLSAAPAAAQKTVNVTLTTEKGPIVVAIEVERAPVTAANFLRYVDAKRMDGATFYRAVNVAAGYGLVQGSLTANPAKAYPPIAHEPTSKTSLTHGDGTLSMARGAPGTASSDFFITQGAMTSLDADPRQPGDNLGFAAFGRVTAGMDVVKAMLEAPVSPTLGEGVMRGQMIAAPIRIISARRSE